MQERQDGHTDRAPKPQEEEKLEGTGVLYLAGVRGEENNMKEKKERTWFEEDHAATARNWSKVRAWWVTE